MSDGTETQLSSLGPFVGEARIDPALTVFPARVILYTRHCDTILVGVRFYDREMNCIMDGGRTTCEISLSKTIDLEEGERILGIRSLNPTSIRNASV